jgi:hypothetical protein
MIADNPLAAIKKLETAAAKTQKTVDIIEVSRHFNLLPQNTEQLIAF